jgi:hypothetical protein
MHGTKTKLYTFGVKYGAGLLFYFVLRLVKNGAEMSAETAVCELQIFLENSLDFCNINRNLSFHIFVDFFAVLTLQKATRLLLQYVYMQ